MIVNKILYDLTLSYLKEGLSTALFERTSLEVKDILYKIELNWGTDFNISNTVLPIEFILKHKKLKGGKFS